MSLEILESRVDRIIFSPSLPEDKQPKILGSESLRVVSPLTNFTGALTIEGSVGIGLTTTPVEKLEIAGNIKINGDGIRNFEGLRAFETNKSDWLRINPDQTYPGIALHKPVAIGTGGLAVGSWEQLPQGQLKVTSSVYLATNGGTVGIGTVTPNPNVKLDLEGGAYLGYANSITDFGGVLKSGFYQGAGAITGDVPDTSHVWSHLLVIRHSNAANNYQLQIAGTYGVNDRLFFRKIENAALAPNNPSWNELATRGSNVFTGNQEIAGNIKINGDGIRNFQGLRVFETNQSDWLRINPDSTYPRIAVYKNVSIGTGGLAVGEWNLSLSPGQLKVTSSAFLATNGGNVGIGTMNPRGTLDVNGVLFADHYYGNGWNLNNVVTTEENGCMLRATFDENGNVSSGRSLHVTHTSGTGLYDIYFGYIFSDTPTVVVTQIFPGSEGPGGDTRDNAVVVFVNQDKCRIKCGDNAGRAGDRKFSMIAVGPRK